MKWSLFSFLPSLGFCFSSSAVFYLSSIHYFCLAISEFCWENRALHAQIKEALASVLLLCILSFNFEECCFGSIFEIPPSKAHQDQEFIPTPSCLSQFVTSPGMICDSQGSLCSRPCCSRCDRWLNHTCTTTAAPGWALHPLLGFGLGLTKFPPASHPPDPPHPIPLHLLPSHCLRQQQVLKCTDVESE